MEHRYLGVVTRMLEHEERLISSEEQVMPLVIEAGEAKNPEFLQHFLKTHSSQILEDIARYGAVLLRGFTIPTAKDFEDTILSIKGMRGISDAFMSEEGRIQADGLKYVLHTNAVYKTGGTVYLGGFHSENYYNPDVPSYISFCCFKPSLRGGETGLINMSKVYQELPQSLQEKLQKNPFFVAKWRLSEVAKRYQISEEKITELCKQFDLPLVGKYPDQFILMYKPSVFKHPINHSDSLQINLFELPDLNDELRKCFMDDYQGASWFWHRLVWRLPRFVVRPLELIYISCASFLFSPKQAVSIFFNKLSQRRIVRKNPLDHKENKVAECFTPSDVKTLAQLMRRFYCSCLWQKGDILLIDNKQVMHAGMPGTGPRLIRAMITNPIEMSYSGSAPGSIDCTEREGETLGFYASINSAPEFKENPQKKQSNDRVTI